MEPARDVFEPLNGLRGAAALAVLLYHAGQVLVPPSMPKGYLAVDLFFCLSGFVIAHAYDRRLAGGMGAGQFSWLRLQRFYPLYFLGLAIAAAWMALELVVSPPAILSPREYGVALSLGLLFLPGMSGALLYPLNPPSWSLLIELVVNSLYALVFRWLTVPVLLATSAAALAALLTLGTTEVSAGTEPGAIHIGLLRALVSFPLGAAIYRLRLGRSRIPALPVIGLALVPMARESGNDLVVIAVVFPLCIAVLGTCRPGRLDPLYAWIGGISFALYTVHVPLLQLALAVREWLVPATAWAFVGLIVVAADLATRFYDTPIRRFLARRRHIKRTTLVKTA